MITKGFELIWELIMRMAVKLEEIPSVLIDFVIGVLLFFSREIKGVYKIIRTRIALKKKRYSLLDDGIITLDGSDLNYGEDELTFEKSDLEYYLPVPDEQLGILRKFEKNYESRGQKIFCTGTTLEILGNSFGIYDFENLINKHRIKVANEFIAKARQGIQQFNDKKFGIRKIIISRSNEKENRVVTIKLYNTDYFTNRVMKSVYQELKNRQHGIINVKNIVDINNYYPFLTSFGINSLLILEQDVIENLLVLVKRSRHAANMKEVKWHVSMNEGFREIEGGGANLESSLLDGYKTELGINKINNNAYYDLFFNIDTFEIGISNYARVKMTQEMFWECYYKKAKDRDWESVECQLIPYNKRAIRAFLKNEKKVTNIAKYCLLMDVCRN